MSFRAKKHSPWIPEFNQGVMTVGQAAIFDTFWYRGKFARLDRNKFYRRQDFSEQLEPFALEHVSAQFALWGAGLALSAVVLCCCERGRKRGRGKVIVVEARGKREGVK